MQIILFDPFRLVDGTSLSLQLGHRMSDDIDLFTDHPYDSLNFSAIDKFLRKTFKYVSDLAPGPGGMGVAYLVGHSKDESVKLDLFYTDTFIQPALKIGPYRIGYCWRDNRNEDRHRSAESEEERLLGSGWVAGEIYHWPDDRTTQTTIPAQSWRKSYSGELCQLRASWWRFHSNMLEGEALGVDQVGFCRKVTTFNAAEIVYNTLPETINYGWSEAASLARICISHPTSGSHASDSLC